MLNLEFWFTVAVFILFLEISVTLFIFVLLAAGLTYGSNLLRVKLKEYMPLAQHYSGKGAELTTNVSGKAIAPFMAVRSGLAGMRATARGLVTRK